LEDSTVSGSENYANVTSYAYLCMNWQRKGRVQRSFVALATSHCLSKHCHWSPRGYRGGSPTAVQA